MPARTCPTCGGYMPKHRQTCLYCETHDDSGFETKKSKTTENKGARSSNTQSKGEEGKKESNSFEFVVCCCPECQSNIRLKYPFGGSLFKCPTCELSFAIQIGNDNPRVYLFIAQLRASSGHRSASTVMPESVKKAMQVFELPINAGLEEVRIAYKRSMMEYHPDKVAHLGADLRKLALEKTKAFNSAYKIIEKYFENMS